jgi:peptidoglycan/LPS O-acetylase OafA/YrhL
MEKLAMSDDSGETSRIHGFDALRAFSVLLVIFSHTGLLGKASGASPILAAAASVFNANFGVKTFFVLSGFLITSLLIAEHREAGRIDVRSFMLRRALRILPLYVLILTSAVVLMCLGIARPAWTAALYSLLYVYNFLPHANEVNYLNHLWSLAVEEQFYIFWPLIFGLAFGNRRLTINLVAIGLIGACCARIWTGYGSELQTHSPSLWTIPAILPIMAGSVFAVNIDAASAYLRSGVALILSLCIICAPVVATAGPATDTLTAFGICGVIAWIYLNQSKTLVRRLDSGIIGYIGTISYGLYMWQGMLTGNGPYRDAHWPPNIWTGVALTLPVAALSYRYFERPIRALGIRERHTLGKLIAAAK